jgi:microcystin-dependent protein
MSDPFVGEIRILPYTFAPRSWASCSGQTLPISQNQALYAIIGTIYGGNGTTTMQLPDLRARAPIHRGAGPGLTPRQQGQRLGVSSVTLTEAEMPAHQHTIRVVGNSAANQATPANHALADASAPGRGGRSDPLPMYATATTTPSVQMSAGIMTTAGGSQAHENRQPFLGIQFCMSLQGTFPSRD